MSIRVKLIIIFSILAILPMAVVSTKTYLSAKEALIENTIAGLWATAEFKEGEVFLYLDRIKTRTEDFASDGFIRDSLATINARTEDAATVSGNLNQHLIKNKKPLEKDLAFIDIVNLEGRVVASTAPERMGLDRFGEKNFAFKIRQPYLEDIHLNEDATTGQEVSAPIRDRRDSSQVTGFLVNHYDSSVINGLLVGDFVLEMGALTQTRGVGKTGETYLVNKEGFMITDSRFVKDAHFRQKVMTYPVEKCFGENREVKGVWTSYHGDRVAGASMCITAGGFRWTLVSEQSEGETFAQINNLKILSIVFGAIVVFLGGAVALLFARVISNPIRHLTEVSDEISSGKLDAVIRESGRNDEIGVLSRAFNRMVHSLRVLSMAVEQSRASVVITDVDGCIEYVNPQFVKISGYTPAEAKGKKMNIIKSGYISEKIYEELWRTISSGREWRGELYNKKKNGELFWEDVSIFPIKDRDGVITHFVGVQEDITTRKEYERRLIHEAHFDGLTELPNRLLALDRLSQALVRARRKKQMVAVMYIDLDRFKMVNDTLGHPAGDKLLVEAARRLTSSVRESDTVARLGGDEFLIILQDFQGESQRQIVALAQEILGLFSNPFTCEGQEAFVTASIGITIYPDDGDDATVLLRNADAAMYKAKGEEHNTFRFFTPGMNKEAIERMEMEYHLRHALEKKEFSLHYQPLVEAKSKKIIGAEALLRWNNPRLGSVPPDRFIPVAEDTGIIIPITDWVLGEACREAKGWQEAGGAPSLRVAVNISSRHFVAGDLVRAVSGALKENKLSPEALELEITERLLIENPSKALRVLYELSRIGVRLSLDDFGTGYSALSYLKEFPFQTLKIDRVFIRGITIEKKDVALVRSMIAMSHGMGLKVVGEGVETEPQLELLRSLGCDWIQGYYISKPLPSEQFRRFL